MRIIFLRNAIQVVVLVFVCLAFLIVSKSVRALECAPTRVVNEWAKLCSEKDENDVPFGKNSDGSPIKNCIRDVLYCNKSPNSCAETQPCSTATEGCSTPVFNGCAESDYWQCPNATCHLAEPGVCQCDSEFVLATYKNSCQSRSAGGYGCWILLECGAQCSENFECKSNICNGGYCEDAGGGCVSDPPPGGEGGGGGVGGCGAICSESSECESDLTCAAGAPGQRPCWATRCETGDPGNCSSSVRATVTDTEVQISWINDASWTDERSDLKITDNNTGARVYDAGGTCVGDGSGDADDWGCPKDNSACNRKVSAEIPYIRLNEAWAAGQINGGGTADQCYSNWHGTEAGPVADKGRGVATSFPDDPFVIPRSWLTPGHSYTVYLQDGHIQQNADDSWSAVDCSSVETTFTIPDDVPKGYLEAPTQDVDWTGDGTADGCTIGGWTCDPSSYSTSLAVALHEGHSYSDNLFNYDDPDNPSNSTSKVIPTDENYPIASGTRADVSASCNGTTAHGFTFQIPYSSLLSDGSAHYVIGTARNVLADTTTDGTWAQLKKSILPPGLNNDTYYPHTFTCTPPEPTCTGITPDDDTSDAISGSKVFSINGVSSATEVNLIVTTDDGGSETYAATQDGETSTWTASVDMSDQNLWDDPINLQASLSNTLYTDERPAACSTTLARKVTVTGQVYNDNGTAPSWNDVNGVCESADRTAFSPGALSNLIIGQERCPTGATCTLDGSGAFSIINVSLSNSNKSLTFTPDPTSDYVDSCPPGGARSIVPPYVPPYTAPYPGHEFYVSAVEGAWYQVIGGNIVAESSGAAPAIRSVVPDNCDTNCFLLRSDNGVSGTSGLPLVGPNSTITTDIDNPLVDLNEEANKNIFAEVTSNGADENYEYFKQMYSLGDNPTSLENLGNLQESDLGAEKLNNGAYFADGPVTIDTLWDVAPGEKYVIFVDGNLTVNGSVPGDPQIQVASGGFLAFIVNGNITFSKSLTVAPGDELSEDALVEGVFIADGTLTVEANDSDNAPGKFIGEGTFVGWSNIVLNRDFLNNSTTDLKILNNTLPAELFRARPDFALNAPDEMKKPVYDWHEVEP